MISSRLIIECCSLSGVLRQQGRVDYTHINNEEVHRVFSMKVCIRSKRVTVRGLDIAATQTLHSKTGGS
jgi:hypothetical protein